MISNYFYLDNRSKKAEQFPIRLYLARQSKVTYLNTGVKIESRYWNSKQRRAYGREDAALINQRLDAFKLAVESELNKIYAFEPDLLQSLTLLQIRDELKKRLDPMQKEINEGKSSTFLFWFDRFMDRKQGRSRELYESTRRKLIRCFNERRMQRVRLDDFGIAMLEQFEDYLLQTNTLNSAAIDLRNIRAVLNYAIKYEATTNYPFRFFKIRTRPTLKRNYKVDTLSRIMTHKCKEEWQERYLDFWRLTFFLIGINAKDLCYLKRSSTGRADYIRAKTHRPYSIKIEPEAQAIIDKYAGENYLVNFVETCKNYRYFYNRLSLGLKEIKSQLGLTELTTYWARHSWATIARKIGISKDTIRLALGHGGHEVTDIYIEEDIEEVDRANRRVIDYVLHGESSLSQ